MTRAIPDIYRELKQFQSVEPENAYRGKEGNIFWTLDEKETLAAEQKMGAKFPPQIRRFYEEVGYGKLEVSRSGSERIYDPNEVLSPGEVAVRFLRETEEIEIWPELWDEDELPVFKISGKSCLVMRRGSPDPDAIYWTGDVEPVAPDFVTFLERLYEDPVFYLDEDLDDDEA